MSSLCDVILSAKEMKEKAMERGRARDCEAAKEVMKMIDKAMEKGDSNIIVSALNLKINIKSEFAEAMEKKGFRVDFLTAGEYRVTWD